jgi:hypothetical protein
MAFDPNRSLRVTVELDSPHYVTFGMWYKKPGDSKWTPFAGGKDDDSAQYSNHGYEIGEVPRGTALYYFFHFAGQKNTVYRATITLIQNANPISRPTVLRGTTGEVGLAKKEKEVTLS